MSAVLQIPSYLEQPRLPEPGRVQEQFLEKAQPTAPKKPVCAVGLLEDGFWLKIKQQVPADALKKALDDTYVIEDRTALASFIEENRLGRLLLEAREPLNAAFGDKAIKVLTLVRDDEGFETLFCLVMVTGAWQDARRALRRFDQQWWLARSGQVSGRLNFDIELI